MKPSKSGREYDWFGVADYGIHWLNEGESFEGSFTGILTVTDSVIDMIDCKCSQNHFPQVVYAQQYLSSPDGIYVGVITGTVLVIRASDEILGQELITNGTFDTDSDWSKGDGWSIANGVATYTGTVDSNLSQAIITPLASRLRLTYEVVESSIDGSLFISNSGFTGEFESLNKNVGIHTYDFTNVKDVPTMPFRVVGNTSGSISIDNVSIKEVSPKTNVGSEIVENGTFNTDLTGWSADGTTVIAWDNGQMRVTTTDTSNRRAYQIIPLEAGKKYIIKNDITDVIGSGSYYIGSSIGADDILLESSNPEQIFTAGTGGNKFLVMKTSPPVGSNSLFDNISVREITEL